MSAFEKGIAIWFVAIAAGGAWLYTSSIDRQAKAASSIIASPPVLPVPAQTPKPLDVPEHIQAACMSIVRGRVPNGTRVTGISVAYDHSLDEVNKTTITSNGYSFKAAREVHYFSDVNFYIVTMEAEVEGRRFSSRYGCRQIGSAIEIMRG